MEWATQWHGPEGKVHADKRTVEYTGRGNHSADAVSFVGAVSVGDCVSERARADEAARLRLAPCLESPLDAAVAAQEAVQCNESVEDSDAAPAAPALAESAKKASESKKNKHRSGDAKAVTSRKKRRVSEKREQEDEASLLQLPVYYFEVQVLATRHFQGCEPSQWSQNGSDAADQEEEDGGDGSSEVQEEDGGEVDEGDESDEVAMEIDLTERSGMDEAFAPWRGRARRLIHDHLRALAPDVVATTTRPSTRANGNGPNGNGNAGVSATEDGPLSSDSADLDRSSSTSELGSSNGNGRVVRSTFTALSPPPPPPAQSAHQQMLLSFPLSSSTIQQIRLRLERQQQQTHSHRRRFSSSSSSGTVPLSSAISTIQARQRRETVRRKRSSHRVCVGFMFCKDGYDYKRDLCHDELGRQACSIAFVGRTGAIQSNGQTFLQTEERFGHGDTVGCGVILDSRTVFWTINGRLVATIAVNDVHHLDEYEDHAVSDDSNRDWFTVWADQLLPAVSLHEHGECVRALFDCTDKERFRFDLNSFKQQQLKERQASLASYASSKALSKTQPLHGDEEDTMHQLVEDYFVHFGYGNALSALQDLHRGTSRGKRSRSEASVGLRHTLRQLIYSFKTKEAICELGSSERQVAKRDPTVLLHCRLLCVIDVLYEGKKAKRRGTDAEAVSTAQNVLYDYLSKPDEKDESLSEIRAFMSVLLYPSVDAVPLNSPGRRYLLWQFREEVADALNNALLGDEPAPCGIEKLVNDLAELQRECLTCGASTYPLDSDSAVYFPCGHRRNHSHLKKHQSSHRLLIDADSDDDNSHDSNSSSSGESDEDDDEDDDDE